MHRKERARRGAGLVGTRADATYYWQVTPTALNAATTSLRE
jgi:hypothetical protein